LIRNSKEARKMDSDKKPDSSEASGHGLAVPKSTSRRRLLQAGLGASPVLLTVVSEPVRAFVTVNSVTCSSASAFASISAAGAAGVSANTRQVCTGRGPVSWSTTSVSGWPAGTFAVSGKTAVPELFGQVFSPGVKVGENASPTLKDVVAASASSSRTLSLARYFAAAYLNFKQGYTPPQVVTDIQLKAMWPKAVAGTYTPVTGGQPWSDTDLINWFKQSMSTT
jgi:hypothetical protein